MKDYIKHMSEQTHRIPSSPKNKLDKWIDGVSVGSILIIAMIYLLRYPIIFIVSLFVK